jgi:tetratricopeptide (TPR) repeat protein
MTRCLRTAWLIAIILMLLCMAAACPSSGRDTYQQALRKYDASDYPAALALFDKAAELEPESVMIMYGRALTLYKLERFEEAISAFDTFIDKSEPVREDYRDERSDAAFYRDKSRLALGQELEQNEEAIPPPPMGE